MFFVFFKQTRSAVRKKKRIVLLGRWKEWRSFLLSGGRVYKDWLAIWNWRSLNSSSRHSNQTTGSQSHLNFCHSLLSFFCCHHRLVDLTSSALISDLRREEAIERTCLCCCFSFFLIPSTPFWVVCSSSIGSRRYKTRSFFLF